MPRCSAPWYELNISAPDNIVSACCFYAGEKDAWSNEPVAITSYWNSPAMRTVRRVNGLGPAPEPNGCSSCFYFQNRTSGAQYFDFDSNLARSDLSPAQRANLARARDDFAAAREEATATPLRIYANFGFTCNLSCIMCHQVPRRATNRRQVTAESLLAWREALESALDVTVIGGEPFALPEAIAFIRTFIAEPSFEPVRLTICTNGTVHHKHMDLLQRKRKLSFAISLDSIEEGYEHIRAGGTWSLVERNILRIVELQQGERPEWDLQTNALILKSGIPRLPRFAEWHAQHHIVTSFYDFINSRGTEDAFLAENVLHNPQLLDDMPNWRDYFEEAIDIFRRAKLTIAADTLDHYRSRLTSTVAAYQEKQAERGSVRGINAWEPLLSISGAAEVATQLAYCPAPLSTKALYAVRDDEIAFTGTREGDHVVSAFLPITIGPEGGVLRLRLRWGALGTRRRVHVWLQTEDLRQLEGDYRISSAGGASTQLEMIARLQAGEHRVRIVAMPVGEDESILPEQIEFDVAGGSREQLPDMAPLEAEPDRSGGDAAPLAGPAEALGDGKSWRIASPVRRLRRFMRRMSA